MHLRAHRPSRPRALADYVWPARDAIGRGVPPFCADGLPSARPVVVPLADPLAVKLIETNDVVAQTPPAAARAGMSFDLITKADVRARKRFVNLARA